MCGFGSSNSTTPEALALIFLQETVLMESPLWKESWSPRNLHYTIKDTKKAGRRGRSLRKVNRLHLAPVTEHSSAFVPAAAAELGAGSGFYAIHRPMCFHILQFLVLCLEMPAWDHEQKTTKCAFSVCHIHLLELIFETSIMCKHVCQGQG